MKVAVEILSALQNGAVETFDQRGLMPLDEARKIVEGTEEFRRGEATVIHDQVFWESDFAWAAIMSLENVEEFLKEASRIKWYFHPRGGRNAALVLRYGEGILPWLKGFLRADGHFVNVPWCVLDCLMAIGTKEVFDYLWGIKSVTDGTEGFPGPFAADDPGDADLRMESRFEAKAPAEADQDADAVVTSWVQRHGEIGETRLRELAKKGDIRAAKFLTQLGV